MRRSLFLTIVAAINVGAGIGLLTTPAMVLARYGITLDGGGILAAKFLSAALIGQAVMLWLAKRSPDSPAMNGIMWGGFVGNVLEGVIVKKAVLAGAMNSTGWLIFAMDLLIAIGFAAYLFGNKKNKVV